jgi:hypothetical protein
VTLKALVSISLGLGLSACLAPNESSTYQATLRNAQGQNVTCRADGSDKPVTGRDAKDEFDECVNTARAAGYTDLVKNSRR